MGECRSFRKYHLKIEIICYPFKHVKNTILFHLLHEIILIFNCSVSRYKYCTLFCINVTIYGCLGQQSRLQASLWYQSVIILNFYLRRAKRKAHLGPCIFIWLTVSPTGFSLYGRVRFIRGNILGNSLKHFPSITSVTMPPTKNSCSREWCQQSRLHAAQRNTHWIIWTPRVAFEIKLKIA